LIKEANKLIESGELTAIDANALDKRLQNWDQVLGVIAWEEPQDEVDADRIEAMIAERNEARQSRNFARADEIRDQLLEQGIILQDTPEGTRWRKK
jgi:cysteinyl-tRNA synthetase